MRTTSSPAAFLLMARCLQPSRLPGGCGVSLPLITNTWGCPVIASQQLPPFWSLGARAASCRPGLRNYT